MIKATQLECTSKWIMKMLAEIIWLVAFHRDLLDLQILLVHLLLMSNHNNPGTMKHLNYHQRHPLARNMMNLKSFRELDFRFQKIVHLHSLAIPWGEQRHANKASWAMWLSEKQLQGNHKVSQVEEIKSLRKNKKPSTIIKSMVVILISCIISKNSNIFMGTIMHKIKAEIKFKQTVPSIVWVRPRWRHV